MDTAKQTPTSVLVRRVRRLQVLTTVWMSIEVGVALGAAWIARSPALLGFGGDSAVELLSAIIVLWQFRFRSDSANAERLNPAWGAPRIHGELLKLGIDIGESSVSKYMVRCRKPPSQTWLSVQLRPRRRKRNLYPVSHSAHSLRPRLRSEYRSRADRGVRAVRHG